VGRDEEFTEFYTGRFDWARRTAYALCGNWVEAEEIAQNAFVRTYAKWKKVRRESAEAYLRTVMTRIFLDSRRRGRAREQSVADVPETGIENDHVRAHEGPSLLTALQSVPPGQRAVLVLRFVHDLSVEQTAATLRCSEGTVKSQSARGLKTLREAYGRDVSTECA
jgi:RNA polymerase sigma-70 factor (sigma-E family)